MEIVEDLNAMTSFHDNRSGVVSSEELMGCFIGNRVLKFEKIEKNLKLYDK